MSLIKSTRIKTSSGPDNVVGHVFYGEENEEVTCLLGDEETVKDAFYAATGTYAIRHVSITTSKQISEAEARLAAKMYVDEFSAGEHPIVLVQHRKPRTDGKSSPVHWHALIWETHPRTGRILNYAHSFRRNEKLARLMDLEFGDELVPGWHTESVIRALRAEGREREAGILEASENMKEKPMSSFTDASFQEMKRQGINLSKVRNFVRDAYKKSRGGDGFLSRLSEAGLTVGAGRKQGLWIVSYKGHECGALHRHLKMKPADVSAFLGTTSRAPLAAPRPEPVITSFVGSEAMTHKVGEDWVDENGVVHLAETVFDAEAYKAKIEHEKADLIAAISPRF